MPLNLTPAIQEVRAAADMLKAGKAGGSEANTRNLLINPMLETLGWNLRDINEVELEYRVFDGTLLDYALRLEGRPRLFVEAKAMNKTLDDPRFIAQTVNYANNEGVVWCVLTNGLLYRVYKTNEPVGMEQKLLFEADLRDDGAEMLHSLDLLARDAVAGGRLDAWGEEVFADGRVRAALARLGVNPPASLLKQIAQAMEGPAMEERNIAASLRRIVAPTAPPAAPLKEREPAGRKVVPPRPGGYDVAWHKNKGSAAVADLFDRLDTFARSLGGDVTQRPQKQYIGYFRGKRSFFTAQFKRAKLTVWLSLSPGETQPWDATVMRDVTNIGHFGMGDLEYTLSSPDQLPQLEALVRQAYSRRSA